MNTLAGYLNGCASDIQGALKPMHRESQGSHSLTLNRYDDVCGHPSDCCRDGFECVNHVGWFRVERGRAPCTFVLVYVSIRLRESQ